MQGPPHLLPDYFAKRTGHPAASLFLMNLHDLDDKVQAAATQAEVVAFVKAAQEKQMPLVLATNDEPLSPPQGMYPGHAYGVKGLSVIDGTPWLRLRNPAGHNVMEIDYDVHLLTNTLKQMRHRPAIASERDCMRMLGTGLEVQRGQEILRAAQQQGEP